MTEKPVLKFGEIAVAKGFITKQDVEQALKLQNEGEAAGNRELIGLIMLKHGMLTNDQLIDILRYYENDDSL